MLPRIETPSFPMAGLFGGEFRRDHSYTNWRPKGSGDWLLIYTAGGSGYLTTPSHEGTTDIGEAILYAPGDLQDYKTNPLSRHWHLVWVHFVPRPSWYPWLQWPSGSHGVKSLCLERGEVRDRFKGALQRLLQLQQRQLPNVADLVSNALEEALLWAHLTASRGPWMRIDPRIRKAMDYLAADLRQPYRMEVLARHCGLSASRLAHLFKEEAGISAQQFSEKQRMWQAGRLLQLTGLGVAEVAAEVGYDDPFYFSNRFRRYAGKSPSQFRKTKRAA
jgi:AraC family transcriptional regulator of arabinose operon